MNVSLIFTKKLNSEKHQLKTVRIQRNIKLKTNTYSFFLEFYILYISSFNGKSLESLKFIFSLFNLKLFKYMLIANYSNVILKKFK